MVFSSPLFLFGFLPLVIASYFLAPRRARNLCLLAFSLAFYAWGEVFYVGIMLASIAANYLAGRLLHHSFLTVANGKHARLILATGIATNLGLLTSFKYANFLADNVNLLLGKFGIAGFDLAPVHLPLGISFFTFQAISYLVDVYRREIPAQRNLLNLALYISMFPQLIAGPIVRYHDIVQQIEKRRGTLDLFSSGAQRFVYGLAKKVLIADPLGEIADSAFALPSQELTLPLAWIGILSYTLHIYFDFSGYSDMAIGLARMFGFRLLENFNYPYISCSVREFWRRWHISLSTWFRDYVYIPLGGSRRSAPRVYLNLLIVFLLTGVWHGASWNFVVWGLFHGVFLACEHAGFSKLLERAWRPFQHAYLLLVVIFGWVFFRAATLTDALQYSAAMLDASNWYTAPVYFAQLLSTEALLAMAAGIALSTPLFPAIKPSLKQYFYRKAMQAEPMPNTLLRTGLFALLLLLCVVKISSASYSPFIYFRF